MGSVAVVISCSSMHRRFAGEELLVVVAGQSDKENQSARVSACGVR